MFNRRRFLIHVQCPNCGHNAAAVCSENEDCYLSSPGFRVERDPQGMVSTRPANTMTEQRWQCEKCGKLF